MTKDMFPSLVSDASGTLPWSLYVMGASPVLMVLALRSSDRGARGLARNLVLLLAAAMAVACFRDVVLVPQTAGSLTFLGSLDRKHTSELQSLMRISYAVFCLKNKTTTTLRHNQMISDV